MKGIVLLICFIFIVGIIVNISGCVPVEEKEEKNEISEVENMEKDIDPDNLGDIDKEIDEIMEW